MKSKRSIALAVSPLVFCGCSIWVRTQSTPKVAELIALDASAANRDSVLVALGSPQSVGILRGNGVDRELWFYNALAGKMNIYSGAGPLEFVMSFVDFNEDGRLNELLGFWSAYDGKPFRRGKPVSVRELAKTIRRGESKVSVLLDKIGEPQYRGRRARPERHIAHDMLFYDSTRTGSSQIAEHWFIVGCDSGGVVQDILWVSSSEEELADLGEIQPQALRQLTQTDSSYPFPVARIEAVSTSTRIDSGQVEALLRTRPEKVEQIVKVLGNPTARGLKAFLGDEPLWVAHWSSLATSMRGQESGPPPRPIRDIEGHLIPSVTYNVLEAQQTRLFVAHTAEGAIREIYWVRPGTPAAVVQ